jgi:hypothetical protein
MVLNKELFVFALYGEVFFVSYCCKKKDMIPLIRDFIKGKNIYHGDLSINEYVENSKDATILKYVYYVQLRTDSTIFSITNTKNGIHKEYYISDKVLLKHMIKVVRRKYIIENLVNDI